MKIVLVAAAALVLTACATAPRTEPSEQVKELLLRGFTNVAPNYEGQYTKAYTVTLGTCRVKMRWDSSEGGWERLEGLNTEATAAAMLAHKDYQHCVPSTTATTTSPPTRGLSPS